MSACSRASTRTDSRSSLRWSASDASNSQPAMVYGGMSDGTTPSTRRIRRNGEPSQLGVGLVREHLGDRHLGVRGRPSASRAAAARGRTRGTPGTAATPAARGGRRSAPAGPSAGWMVNSSVSLDMPLPSGAVTSLTVAPGARLAFHHAAMRSAIADGSLRHGVESIGSSVVIVPPGRGPGQ